jgi:hypothetical protein
MLSRMSSLSALVELVRNVSGVFIDALDFFRLTLRSSGELFQNCGVPNSLEALR